MRRKGGGFILKRKGLAEAREAQKVVSKRERVRDGGKDFDKLDHRQRRAFSSCSLNI